jgi:hypothetical protein
MKCTAIEKRLHIVHEVIAQCDCSMLASDCEKTSHFEVIAIALQFRSKCAAIKRRMRNNFTRNAQLLKSDCSSSMK